MIAVFGLHIIAHGNEWNPVIVTFYYKVNKFVSSKLSYFYSMQCWSVYYSSHVDNLCHFGGEFANFILGSNCVNMSCAKIVTTLYPTYRFGRPVWNSIHWSSFWVYLAISHSSALETCGTRSDLLLHSCLDNSELVLQGWISAFLLLELTKSRQFLFRG